MPENSPYGAQSSGFTTKEHLRICPRCKQVVEFLQFLFHQEDLSPEEAALLEEIHHYLDLLSEVGPEAAREIAKVRLGPAEP